MFNVTEAAQQKVAEFLTDKDVMPIRIFLQEGGCGGPQISLALDTKKESDSVFEFAGVQYLIDPKLLEEAKPVKVDFIESGFKVTTSLETNGCSSCGAEGSCCS